MCYPIARHRNKLEIESLFRVELSLALSGLRIPLVLPKMGGFWVFLVVDSVQKCIGGIFSD